MAGPDWAAVGIAYVLSVITMVALFVIYICVNRRRRRKKRWTHSSGSRDIHRNESMLSTVSTKPLASSMMYQQRGPSRQTSRQVSQETDVTQASTQKNHQRRTRDYVLKWCNYNNLPETVANALRDKGFITPESLEAIKPRDVQDLGLPNKAMECLLRQVLEDKETQKTRLLSSTSSRDSMIPVRRSSSEEQAYGVISNNPAGPDAPLLNKSSSAENFSDSQNVSFQSNPFSRNKKSMDSLVLTDVMPPVKKVNGYSPVYVTDNNNRFNGLLSNPGLQRMASLLGREWTFLATQLNISHAKLDHIKLDHPNDTKQQIYHMLSFWRDHQSGTKEQIKGALGSALSKAGRVDLFDMLMQEQVDGSVENVREVSII